MNAKQARFVEEYLVDLNATQAAIRAGYSEKTAYSQGQRLLKHAEVSRALAEGSQQRSDEVGLTVDQILSGIADIALTADRNADRLKALELAGKYRKLFTDRVEHSGQTVVRLIDLSGDD